jgi:hypothetical protein
VISNPGFAQLQSKSEILPAAMFKTESAFLTSATLQKKQNKTKKTKRKPAKSEFRLLSLNNAFGGMEICLIFCISL